MMQGDSVDILEWGTDTIRVLVPSVGRLVNELKGTAGTGQIAVKDHSGSMALSGDTLRVRYALDNRRPNSFLTSHWLYLIDTNGTGGYSFQYSPGFSSQTAAVSVFEAAIRKWRCATGVAFSISPSLSPADSVLEDGINSVFWDSLGPGTLGITRVFTVRCFDLVTNDLLFLASDIDLTFDSSKVWHFDTLALPPAASYDFFSVVIHELGHAHILEHVIQPGKLMHYAAST